MRSRMLIRQLNNDVPMGDCNIQPCHQEADNFIEMYAEIERQRPDLEEIASFEKAVCERQAYTRRHGRTTCEAELLQVSDLAGLAVHSRGPIPGEALPSLDVAFGESARARRREKISTGQMLPPHMLVAKPVSRSEFIKSPKAMDA